MHFNIIISDPWMWFCIAFGLTMVTSLLMQKVSANMKTRDGSLHKFSIMDLEFPASALDMVNVINGIYRLPEADRQKSLRSLKLNLFIDFFFMPGIYGINFLICMHVAGKTTHIGPAIFETLAWLQLLAWLCDIIENIYIFIKIRPKSEPSSKWAHILYMCNVYTKWGIALIGGICSTMVLLYFWLSGRYNPHNLEYALILLAEIAGVVLLGFILNKLTKTAK